MPGPIRPELHRFLHLIPPDAMLVNDLDLKVTESSNTFYPWKLDRDNPSDMATNTTENDVDNVEVVFIENPVQNATIHCCYDHDGMTRMVVARIFRLLLVLLKNLPCYCYLQLVSVLSTFPPTQPDSLGQKMVLPQIGKFAWIRPGFDTTGIAPVLVSENPIIWEGLQPDTEYEWYVRSVGSGGNSSEWVGPDMFKTLSDDIQVILMQQKLLARWCYRR